MLDSVPSIDELREKSIDEMNELAASIREFLIDITSEKGGHLASNLGVVELTLALFRVFDFPKDRIIFDVGHQAYTYKILSGRLKDFQTLREYGGLSGFPKSGESDYDAFNTGHSSTSLSAGLGMVRARDLKHEDHQVISLIGDGSMTGGMAFEALNDAAQLNSGFIIILNDNDMSISRNVGGMSRYLTKIRAGKRYNHFKLRLKKFLSRIPKVGENIVDRLSNLKDGVKELAVPSGMLFENMGITYLGPVDGHNIAQMENVFRKARDLNKCVLIHVKTKKGKGYPPAEKHPEVFHGVAPFDKKTGIPKKPPVRGYTDLFAEFMLAEGRKRQDLIAVSAAMVYSIGLQPFSVAYPDRCFDAGIAEQHAVTFAAGAAKAGLKPVVAIYSSFLQRAYDQIVHDVCMQDLPVTFAIDRAGLVGKDGETHQGVFDIAFLGNLPNMIVMAPKNGQELVDMLAFSLDCPHPSAVRYSRGAVYEGLSDHHAPIETGKAEVIFRESSIALLAVGEEVQTAEAVRKLLKAEGYAVSLINMRFIKPFDKELLRELSADHSLFVTLEDGVKSGGFGEKVAAFAEEEKLPVRVIVSGIPDSFIEQGDVKELKKALKLDPASVAAFVKACGI